METARYKFQIIIIIILLLLLLLLLLLKLIDIADDKKLLDKGERITEIRA